MSKKILIPFIFSFVFNLNSNVFSQNTTELENSSPIYSISGPRTSKRHYKIVIHPASTNLEIKISGGTGDCDLYVKKGQRASTNNYDYRPYRGGNNETVSIKNPAAGEWYIMLYGYSEYRGLTLQASFPEVTFPATGITWRPGMTYRISWRGFTGTNVKIELYERTTQIRTIRSSIRNDVGSYNWSIPANFSPSDEYMIKISSKTNSEQYDYTGFFSINSVPEGQSRAIQFAEKTWWARGASGGPAGGEGKTNAWDGSARTVDETDGTVKMRIRKENNTWYCSEISSRFDVQYGTYRIVLDAGIDNMDKHTVFGFFLYKDDHTEIDIEFFSKDGLMAHGYNGQFLVQPRIVGGNKKFKNWFPFLFDQAINYTTHFIEWQEDYVRFASYQGNIEKEIPSLLIKEKELHQSEIQDIADIPKESDNPKLIFNYWLLDSDDQDNIGDPPTDSQNKKVVLHDFSYTDTERPKVTYPTDPGISWKTGEKYNITRKEFSCSRVKIYLYRGTRKVWTITNSTPNDGSYFWTVPSNQSINNSYKIKIESDSDPSQYDFSDSYFAVTREEEITIFSENFEGSFPSTQWLADDNDPLNGDDYWNDQSINQGGRAIQGLRSLYCADKSDMPGQQYDDYMLAYAELKNGINLSDYRDVKLSFKIWIHCENGYDKLRWYASKNGINWVKYNEWTGDTEGWESYSFDLLNFDTFWIKFEFSSDYSIHNFEGAYIDDIQITGKPKGLAKENPDNNGQPVVKLIEGKIFPLTEPQAKEKGTEHSTPINYSLKQNYPNPFNSKTVIEYNISKLTNASLTIYNSLGEHVTMLQDKQIAPGLYRIIWNGTDKYGKLVPSGIYFLTLEADQFKFTKKMLLFR